MGVEWGRSTMPNASNALGWDGAFVWVDDDLETEDGVFGFLVSGWSAVVYLG